jgi:translocation and assembly module TamB
MPRLWLRRMLHWGGGAILLLLVVAAASFGLLQTSPGLAWAERLASRLISSPGFAVEIKELGGTVPFDMHAERIEVSDAKGVWLTLDDARIDLSATALVGRRAQIGTLGAGKIEIVRQPEPTGPPAPLADNLRVPRLPVSLTIDRLSVGRLVLDPPLFGESIEAAIDGHATQSGEDTDIAFNLRRTDNKPGGLEVQMRQTGADPILSLKIAANEPTGLLLNRLLARTDYLPLSVSFAGEGPLTQWHGKLDIAAGQAARFNADVSIAAARDTIVSLGGTAALAPLLTPQLAAALGDTVPVNGRMTLREDGAVALDVLSLHAAAGTLTANARMGGPDRAVAAHLRLSMPGLAIVTGQFGQPVQGAAQIDITVSGTEDRPLLRVDGVASGLKMGSSGVDRVESHVDLSWPDRPNERIEIAAQGAIAGIAVPGALPTIGRDLTWSIAAKAAPDGSTAELTQLSVHGAGVDAEGSGRLAEMGRRLNGRLHLSIADLKPLTGLFGQPMAGELTLTALAEQQSPDLVTATLDGAVTKLQSGIATADALTGGTLTINGSARRGTDGVVVLDGLSMKAADADLTMSGRFEPQTRQLAATLDAVVASLQPLSKEMGSRLTGRLAAHVTADGPLEQLQLRAGLEGTNLAAGATALDSLRLDARITDPTVQPQLLLTGEFRAGGLDGSLSFAALHPEPSTLTLRQLRLKAGGGNIAGDLQIDLATLLTSGSLDVSLPDLAPWSRLAGMPLAGRADLHAKLTSQRGQAVELTVNGAGLATGSGGGRITLGQLAASARIADALGTPTGSGQSTVTGVAFAGGNIAKASLALDSAGPGRFAFRADAAGTVQAPLMLALGGTAELTPRTGAFDLQLARLNGTFGADKFQLTQALRLSAHGGDFAMSGLAFTYGRGQLSGDASRRGSTLSLRLTGRDLDLAALSKLAGRNELGGTLAFDANIGGSVAAPQGRFTLTGSGLRLALPKQRLPTLGLNFDGTWNGRELGFDGHVNGLKGAALRVSGSAPVVLTPSSFSVSFPPQGRLALQLQGAGELANIADLLPLGEDSLSGKFSLDAGVNGTLAAPTASGHLTISEGRYANFATGVVLTHLRADISGDRDRVTVREFSAKDTGSGVLDARGSLTLADGAPSADLAAILQNFRILGRDEGVLTASGDIRIAGPVASPRVTAQLTAGEGDLRIPDNLPPGVTKLQVVEINSQEVRGRPASSQVPSRPPVRQGATKPGAAKPSTPTVPATLDIKISLPGKVFVRGRGLDSEWRGRFTVSGTSDAPKIVGSLEVVRGTFDILGKTFKVTQGTISFDGARTLDPTLDIVAEIVSGDVVARVLVTGSASAPKIAITSTPTMPQEQILSYVLFNRPNTQISAAEGIQVAQAAATLAGGGPGVLDRLRGRVGLDRLVFGSSTGTNTSSSLNPAAGGSSTSGTSVSGGKYLAEGVYVGATQGLTPQSSKMVVEVEIRPRVTVQGDFSQTGGTGLGLNYKYDY